MIYIFSVRRSKRINSVQTLSLHNPHYSKRLTNFIFSRRLKMAQTTTYSVIRYDMPDLSSSDKIHLLSSLSRWCDRHSGRVLSNPDSTFVLTDLDGASIGQFTHILDCYSCVYQIRLISRTFFDKLFDLKAVG